MPATVLIYFFVVVLSKKAGVLKEAVLPSGIAALVERLVQLQGKFVLRRDICGAPCGVRFHQKCALPAMWQGQGLLYTCAMTSQIAQEQWCC